jgi:hypothetical protein
MTMAEKVARLQLRREPGWLYFLRGEEIWRTPLRRPGVPDTGAEHVVTPGFTDEDAHEPEPRLVGPVEKIARLRIVREPFYLYYFRGAELWRTRMKRAGEPAAGPAAERIADAGITPEAGWHYFLDNQGDAARLKQVEAGEDE